MEHHGASLKTDNNYCPGMLLKVIPEISDQQILVIFSSCLLFVPPFLNEFAVCES